MTFDPRPKYLVAALALSLSSLAFAQTPAASTAKPTNATGQCKDGTYSTAASKSGACRGHNGVKDWYAVAAIPAAGASNAQPTPSSSAARPASLPAVASAPTQSTPTSATPAAKPAPSKGPKANLASTPQAPGGGPGLVWVNTSSNVYHCPGTDFYGKTKTGSYMSESVAKSKGARPDHGNACTK